MLYLIKTLFQGMISAAAAFPQKFGFEFWKGSGIYIIYHNEEKRLKNIS